AGSGSWARRILDRETRTATRQRTRTRIRTGTDSGSERRIALALQAGGRPVRSTIRESRTRGGPRDGSSAGIAGGPGLAPRSLQAAEHLAQPVAAAQHRRALRRRLAGDAAFARDLVLADAVVRARGRRAHGPALHVLP